MCDQRCIVPPSPELEERIIRSRQELLAGHTLPDKPTVDVLDLRSVTRILTRPPRTRAHTLISHVVDFAPITGVRRALVLLVDFSDEAATQSRGHYQDMLFSVGSQATGSMRDYYREVSYQQLDVIGEVSGTGGVTAGWYRAPQTKAYYTNGDYGFGDYPRNAQKLVEDVVDLAAPHLNFADYDNDGDGVVDALVIIAAGTGGEVSGDTGDIWSHKWGITPRNVDGVQVRNYFMAPEDGRVGVMAHELGHLLMKWPDLYDTDYTSRGTGRWDLMAGGSWNDGGNTPAHPTAWCKVKAGWVTPTTIFNAQQSVTLQPYARHPDVYRLPIGSPDSKEYFLVSNRQQAGFDTHLPGEGCLIEHVDDNQSNNTDETHYLVDIEQADGQGHLNSNANAGDAEDPYPTAGNNAFTVATTPASKAYDGSDSRVAVTDIQRVGDTITTDINVGGVTAKAWHNHRAVLQTYSTYHSQNAWARIQGLGWRKIETGSADGVTNTFLALCEAQANDRQVSVYADGDTLYRMYLL
ncbi:M6 family metalloprotease domain-containing protein [Halomonas sp. M4R1S46]|uniref:M6 family metalloprotease domain-containing protein n=1 Tax=Halomonas sp. M4R1S46 TaxID=2982692 RepID=UPI0021E4A379|nr:M6 family metalloprotease domain-containing protein [Halomonas sp. M4R1S46]UYG09115.1 M6 family metalloprotease domain-containing protein [Halomonas sp. M4R1S46]